MITFLRPAGFASGCSIGICGGVPRIESIMVAIIFFLIPQAVVTAQVPYPPNGYPAVAKPAPQLRKLHPNDGRGTVEMVTPGMLRLRLKAGEFWNVVPAANADIQVVGTASRELLQAGQFVNCDIKIDEFGKVIEPATRVTFTGGGVPSIVAPGLGILEPGTKRISGRRPAGSYLVSGTIKFMNENSMTLQIGSEKFEITVPAEAELLVNTRNVGLSSVGDAVQVRGEYYEKGQLRAPMMKITLAKPVAPPEKNRGIPKPATKPLQ